MKKYIVIYHAPEELMAQSANASPEDMDKGMEDWMKWAAKCGDQLIDLGNPLMGGQKLSPDGNSQSSTRGVAGYSILQAADMDDVKSLLIGHPHLASRCDGRPGAGDLMPLPGSE